MTGIHYKYLYGGIGRLLMIWTGVIFAAHGLITTDTCQAEALNYMCTNSDELIVSKSAIYGRTGTGCSSTDFGYKNCSVNALGVVDRLCSGKTKCDEMIVRDEAMPSLRCTIPTDFSRNLQYSFTCVAVLQARSSLEQLPPVNMIMNQSLTSPTNSSITCATENNPLTIKANKGQVIKISVTNFVHVNVPTICDANGAFGYVNDVYNATNPKALICKAARESVILTSTGEAVQLVITEGGNFILKFQVLDDETPSCDHQQEEDTHSGCILQLDDGSTPCERGAFGTKSAKFDWAWYLIVAIGLLVVGFIIIVAIVCLCRFLRNRKRNVAEKNPPKPDRKSTTSYSYDHIRCPDAVTPAVGQGDEEYADIDENPPVNNNTSQDQDDGEYASVVERTPATDNQNKKDTKKKALKPPVKTKPQTPKTDTNANTDKTEPPPAVEYTQIDPKTKRTKKADISDPIPIKSAAEKPAPKKKPMAGNAPPATPTKTMQGNAPPATPTNTMQGHAPPATPTNTMQGHAPPATPTKPGSVPPTKPARLSDTTEEGDKKGATPGSTGAHGNGLNRGGNNRGTIYDKDGLALNETYQSFP